MNAVRKAAGKIVHEIHCLNAGELANAIGWHKLCVRIECNERPHTDVCPNLINLYALALQAAHFSIHQCGAAIVNLNQQAHDRIAMNADHPFSRTNRAAFN